MNPERLRSVGSGWAGGGGAPEESGERGKSGAQKGNGSENMYSKVLWVFFAFFKKPGVGPRAEQTHNWHEDYDTRYFNFDFLGYCTVGRDGGKF